VQFKEDVAQLLLMAICKDARAYLGELSGIFLALGNDCAERRAGARDEERDGDAKSEAKADANADAERDMQRWYDFTALLDSPWENIEPRLGRAGDGDVELHAENIRRMRKYMRDRAVAGSGPRPLFPALLRPTPAGPWKPAVKVLKKE
jgi:hypothetical protein